MRLIMVGCEYSGTSTLGYLIGQTLRSAEFAGASISIFVWFGVLWRPSLSAIGSAVNFAAENRTRGVVQSPPSLRRMFRNMHGILPLLCARLDRRTLPFLGVQDAAGGSSDGPQGATGSFSLCAGFASPRDL